MKKEERVYTDGLSTTHIPKDMHLPTRSEIIEKLSKMETKEDDPIKSKVHYGDSYSSTSIPDDKEKGNTK